MYEDIKNKVETEIEKDKNSSEEFTTLNMRISHRHKDILEKRAKSTIGTMTHFVIWKCVLEN